LSPYIIFFFFQAEDGIRDGHVTGVQTCALPISPMPQPTPTAPAPTGAAPTVQAARTRLSSTGGQQSGASCRPSTSTGDSPTPSRSEERRVGKEGRYEGAEDR